MAMAAVAAPSIGLIATPAPARAGAIDAAVKAVATPTLQQVFAALAGARPATSAKAPSIKATSRHRDYALLRAAGVTKAEACRRLTVSERQAQRWEAELREQGRLFFGREVEYLFVAAYVVSEQWKGEVEGIFGSQNTAMDTAAAASRN